MLGRRRLGVQPEGGERGTKDALPEHGVCWAWPSFVVVRDG